MSNEINEIDRCKIWHENPNKSKADEMRDKYIEINKLHFVVRDFISCKTKGIFIYNVPCGTICNECNMDSMYKNVHGDFGVDSSNRG